MNAVAEPVLAGQVEWWGSPGVWLAAGRATPTNEALVAALRERGVRAQIAEPGKLRRLVRREDVVLGRLDVRPTLDGVEDGIWELRHLQRVGIRVLNSTASLVACHDKLQTALRLGRLGIPQPATAHVDRETPLRRFDFPVVLKPRFGSWGADVVLCESEADLSYRLAEMHDRPWFRRQGVIVQALVPPAGFDLRLVVAGGQVVGAIERVAAAGEWRTSIALGGTRRQVTPPSDACALAVMAAAAVKADVIGVDLLPSVDGRYVVLELNGAVDFTSEYSLPGQDVFDEAARSLEGVTAGRLYRRSSI